jgi:SAM-dependent methyltransferase
MPWYKELFSKEDPFREEKYRESEDSRAQVDFAISALELQPPGRILDLCCGQGRHLLDLTRRGFDVVGVDLSERMLSKCRAAASGQGLQPRLIQADMRELPFDSEFDAVISMWDSFGYLESVAEDQKALDAVSRALKPGGKLLLDYLHHRNPCQKPTEPRSWYENEARDLFLTEWDFDSDTSCIHQREICIRASGERQEQYFDLRVYEFEELEKMLDASGMSVQHIWADRNRTPFTPDSRGMEIVGVKR